MLPTLLCEQLCSLNPGADRLAFSCVWMMEAAVRRDHAAACAGAPVRNTRRTACAHRHPSGPLAAVQGTLTPKPAWFGKSVIRSCAKLDYATAQRMIDGLITEDMAAVNDIGARRSPAIGRRPSRRSRPAPLQCCRLPCLCLLDGAVSRRRTPPHAAATPTPSALSPLALWAHLLPASP